MPGRTWVGGDEYRYTFNGKEDDKIVNSGFQDYGFRVNDTRIGRFFSVDPLKRYYPELTPYQFASNTPITAIDLDGLEALDYRTHLDLAPAQLPLISLVTYAFDWLSSPLLSFSKSCMENAQNSIEHKTKNAYTEQVPEETRQLRFKIRDIKTKLEATAYVIEFGDRASTIINALGGLQGVMNIIHKRMNIAQNFYERFGEKEIESKIRGIDFFREVEIVTLEKGTEVWQWTAKDGKSGKYFAPKNADRFKLGIDPSKKGEWEGFILTEPTEVLKSTADWMGKNPGGSIQYFSPNLIKNTKPISTKKSSKLKSKF